MTVSLLLSHLGPHNTNERGAARPRQPAPGPPASLPDLKHGLIVFCSRTCMGIQDVITIDPHPHCLDEFLIKVDYDFDTPPPMPWPSESALSLSPLLTSRGQIHAPLLSRLISY